MTIPEARDVARMLAARTDPTTGKPLPLDNRTVEACLILAECASLAHRGYLYIAKHLRADKATLALIQPQPPLPPYPPNVPRHAGSKWTADEEHKLLARFDRSIPLALLAKEHDRTLVAISERLQKLGRIVPADQVPSHFQPKSEPQNPPARPKA